MKKEGFMINNFIKQFFKWYHRISSVHSCDKLFVGRAETTCCIDKKVDITWRVTENSKLICNLFNRNKKISDRE